MTPLELLNGRIRACAACPLAAAERDGAFHVPGEGPENARVVIVGEAPGAEEERTGRPFIGRSGALLTEMLTAAGLDRSRVFVTSVCKCRPPENRAPRKSETAACLPWLTAQLDLIRPEIVLCAGNVGTRALLGAKEGIGALRGRFHSFTLGGRVMALRPLFHPAYLLRNPGRAPGSPRDLTLRDLIEARERLERA